MYTAFSKVLNVFIYETMERNSVFFLDLELELLMSH